MKGHSRTLTSNSFFGKAQTSFPGGEQPCQACTEQPQKVKMENPEHCPCFRTALQAKATMFHSDMNSIAEPIEDQCIN